MDGVQYMVEFGESFTSQYAEEHVCVEVEETSGIATEEGFLLQTTHTYMQ